MEKTQENKGNECSEQGNIVLRRQAEGARAVIDLVAKSVGLDPEEIGFWLYYPEPEGGGDVLITGAIRAQIREAKAAPPTEIEVSFANDDYETRSKECLVDLCRERDKYEAQLRSIAEGAMAVVDFIAEAAEMDIHDENYEMYSQDIGRRTPVRKAVEEWKNKQARKERAFENQLWELEKENKTLKSLLTTAWAPET